MRYFFHHKRVPKIKFSAKRKKKFWVRKKKISWLRYWYFRPIPQPIPNFGLTLGWFPGQKCKCKSRRTWLLWPNQVPSLDHFVLQNSGGFLCWKHKEGVCFYVSNNSQLLRRVPWISAELTIVSSLKHKNSQPLYIFNRVRDHSSIMS